jgi:hypothetical protein
VRRVSPLFAIIFLVVPLFAASNPVPFVNQPLVPSSVQPGAAAFAIKVNGTGFVPGAVVRWNGIPLSTKFINRSQLKAAVPAARVANVGTATVTVSNPAPGGGVSNGVFFSVTAPSTSLTFNTASVTVGTSVSSIAVGDFNNDGRMDLAVVNEGAQYACSNGTNADEYVSILLGKGNGMFKPGGAVELGCIAMELDEVTATVADFNKDGRQDLLVSFQGFVDLSFGTWSAVYLGNGDGTFSAQPSSVLPTDGDETGTAIVGDFNRDGNMDFAVESSDFGTNLIVYLGNGDGTFTGPEETGNWMQGSPAWLVTGDFNNDGILDIAAPFDPIVILLGNGDGTFTQPTSQPTTTMVDPRSSVAGDFNGDGIPDLAFADSGSTALTVLLGNGDGSFTQKNGQPDAGQTTTFITTADFNGDGKLDLALVDSANGILIYLGNGDGTFQTALEIAEANGPLQLGVADFTGNGRLDLAAPNSGASTVSLLLQSPAAIFSITDVKFGQQNVGTTSNPRRVFMANTGSAPMQLAGIVASGDFAETNNCKAAVPMGQSCEIDVVFKPAATGLRSGAITIADNAAGSPQVIQLSGTGEAGLSFIH